MQEQEELERQTPSTCPYAQALAQFSQQAPGSRETLRSRGFGNARAVIDARLRTETSITFITAPTGAGKTTLVHDLSRAHPDALLVVPAVANQKIADSATCSDFHTLLRRHGIVLEDGPPADLLHALSKLLTAQTNATIIIDDAEHLYSPDWQTLNQLLDDGILRHLLLIGMPQLPSLLASKCDALLERCDTHQPLVPFNQQETTQYLSAQLAAAPAPEGFGFTRDAISAVHQFALGVPARINLIAQRSLEAAQQRDEDLRVRKIDVEQGYAKARHKGLRAGAPARTSSAQPVCAVEADIPSNHAPTHQRLRTGMMSMLDATAACVLVVLIGTGAYQAGEAYADSRLEQTLSDTTTGRSHTLRLSPALTVGRSRAGAGEPAPSPDQAPIRLKIDEDLG